MLKQAHDILNWAAECVKATFSGLEPSGIPQMLNQASFDDLSGSKSLFYFEGTIAGFDEIE